MLNEIKRKHPTWTPELLAAIEQVYQLSYQERGGGVFDKDLDLLNDAAALMVPIGEKNWTWAEHLLTSMLHKLRTGR